MIGQKLFSFHNVQPIKFSCMYIKKIINLALLTALKDSHQANGLFKMKNRLSPTVNLIATII